MRVDLALLDLGKGGCAQPGACLRLPSPLSPCGEPDVSVARELDRSGWIDRDATVIAGLVRLQ